MRNPVSIFPDFDLKAVIISQPKISSLCIYFPTFLGQHVKVRPVYIRITNFTLFFNPSQVFLSGCNNEASSIKD